MWAKVTVALRCNLGEGTKIQGGAWEILKFIEGDGARPGIAQGKAQIINEEAWEGA